MRVEIPPPEPHDVPYPIIEDEPDESRRELVGYFIIDADGSEDLALAALDRAEGGTPQFNWGDHYVWVDMYPDDRVVITQEEDLVDEDGDSEHPPQTTITISEARQLLLDWLKAKEAWYAERRETRA